MGGDKSENKITSKLGNVYAISPIKRSIIIWLGFQILLWLIFAFSYLIHKDAWLNVVEVDAASAAVGGGFSTFLFIIAINLFIYILISVGNLFVRFNVVTPGLIVLIIQAVSIGWLAGSNGFEVPFVSVMAANVQFLKVGLWETTAYALACAVTLPKSLLISDTFPAKKWSQTNKFKDIKLSKSEIVILLLGGISLIIAALIETNSIIG